MILVKRSNLNDVDQAGVMIMKEKAQAKISCFILDFLGHFPEVIFMLYEGATHYRVRTKVNNYIVS